MALPVEPTIYTGTAGQLHNSELLAHIAAEYMPTFRQVVFQATPLLKAFSINAFGKDLDPTKGYGNAEDKRESSGKGIVFHDGSFQFEFPLYTTAPSGNFIGHMGNVNPQHNEGAVSGSYAYKRLLWSIYVPEEFVKDNRGKFQLLNRLENEMRLMQMAAARDLDYILTGSSSAPTGAANGLDDLISVTQSGTGIGNINMSNSYWNNIYKPQTTVGGGGELDRPLALLRRLQYVALETREKGANPDSQIAIGTQGAYQYALRAQYADERANAGLKSQRYEAAGLDHIMVAGMPMIYDPNVQVPTGATASTEAIYMADLAELGYHARRDEFFLLENWAAPEPKDKQRFYQANCWLRGQPAVTNRWLQAVIYNLPENPDNA